jgi:hypothetical protein
MKRAVRLLLLLALLPLFANAQSEDSLTVAAEDTSTVQAAPKVHYLWDQEIPADTADESDGLILRQVPASLVKKFRADKDLRYIRKKKEESGFSFSDSIQLFFFFLVRFVSAFYWLLIIVIALVLGIVLYNYLKAQGYIFRGKGAVMNDGTVLLSEEELDLATYEKQIQAAITGGKYRLAVRLLYLQTLRLLVDKEVIIFSKEKTNATYLRAMSNTTWYKSFAALTLDYEYIWYGEIPVNDMQFSAIHQDFSRFMNELGYTR